MSLLKVSALDVSWNMTKRTIMELALEHAYFNISEDWKLKVIEESAGLLKWGKLGGDFYDLMVLGSGDYKKSLSKISDKLLEFCRTHRPYDFVNFVRDYYLKEDLDHTAEFNTILTTLVPVVFSGYNCGYLVGISAEEEVVYTETDLVGPAEAQVIILLITLIRVGRLKIQNKEDGRVEEIRFSKKQIERIKSYMKLKGVSPLVGDLYKISIEELKDVLYSTSHSMNVVYFANFMNIVLDTVYPIYSNFFSIAAWKREDTVGLSSSTIIYLYKVMTDKYYKQEDLLKHRNMYIPDTGITVQFKKKIDDIVSLSLREFHTEEFHLLYISYIINDHLRFLSFDMSNLSKSLINVLYETDIVAIILTFSFLGVSDRLRKTPKELSDMFNVYNNTPADESKITEISDAIDQIISEITKFIRDENIYFESPVHWNYDNKNKPTQGKWGDTYLIEDRKVGVYTRTLPKGHKASDEAKALAKKKFIELGDDKTIVDEFVRKVKRKIRTMNTFTN